MSKTDRNELIDALQRKFTTKEDLALARSELKADAADSRGEFKANLAGVKGELEVKIGEVKSDVLRWLFAFFITTLLAILGLYFKK